MIKKKEMKEVLIMDKCVKDPFDQCFHECEGCPQYIPKDDEERMK